MPNNLVISWFSAGVSSAVATKLALEKHPDMRIIYIHVEDQHEDTMRFLKDCENWFGKKIEILQSELRTVENACLKAKWINGPGGAACTRLLKIRVRKIFEMDLNEELTYVWGFDASEKKRADEKLEWMIDRNHVFPLIEKEILKHEAHGILEKAGIKRPVLYDMGYPNNNCIGCLKAGGGYFRAIKNDFPEVFKKRAETERKIGASIFKDFYLDEMPDDYGRDLKIIVPDCGLFCEVA